MSDEAKKQIARLVARRYYSEKELKDKLKKHPSQQIEEAINWGDRKSVV